MLAGQVISTDNPAPLSQRLLTPAGTQPRRFAWIDAAGIAFVHLIALLAFLPWFFSWSGVALAAAGLYMFGTLGISVCFHRLLTHRSFACPKWLEHTLAILGVCSLQDTPARWVATHRRHHQHADEQPDPHSPWVNFIWAHMGWLVFKNRDLTRLAITGRYARDVLRDPFYCRLERKKIWTAIVLGSWAAFFAAGFGIELLLGGSLAQAFQFALSLLIWGVAVRTVLVWHSSWSVNSVSHLWGYRNYETGESSRNNWLVGYLSGGEGWHNNHHADPRSARHGHLWWETDLGWESIRLFKLLGLATRVMLPSPAMIGAARKKSQLV